MQIQTPVILCHKCGGVLDGKLAGLYGCGCISGYVRDWQVPSPDPVQEQVNATKRRITLFESQKRDESEIAVYRKRQSDLEALLVTA